MENKLIYNGTLEVEPTLVKHKDGLGNVVSLSLEVDVKIELVSNGDCSFLLDENCKPDKYLIADYIVKNYLRTL